MRISRSSATTGAKRCSGFRGRPAKPNAASIIASANEATPVGNEPGNLFPRGSNCSCVAPDFLREVVATVITVLVPGVTGDGRNDAEAPIGKPLAAGVSIVAGAAPAGAVGIVKFADWPAITVCGAGGFGSEKPTMVTVEPLEVPPTGVGLNTVTEAVPAVGMAVAGTEAIN